MLGETSSRRARWAPVITVMAMVCSLLAAPASAQEPADPTEPDRPASSFAAYPGPSVSLSGITFGAVPVDRVAGATRYGTAVEASQRGWPEGARHVIVAPGETWNEALPAASLAGVLRAPMPLAGPAGLDADTVAELERLDADVLAVQEMDQFEEFWKPWLERRGYGGVYKRRAQATAAKKDGCGLFFKTGKLELLARRGLEYNDEAFAGEPSAETTSSSEEDDEKRAEDAPGDAKSPLESLRTFRARNDDSETVSKLPETRKTHVRDGVGILAMLREKRAERTAAESDEDDAEGE